MENMVRRLSASPKYAKLFEWGKLVSIAGSAQILVQALGLISGIIIIRLLPTSEYALYTLANTMLATITLLADGGISTGVLSKGGKVWKDRRSLGSIIVTGMKLRRQFAVASLLISLPVLIYLLLDHGATWISAALIALCMIPAFFAALSDNLLAIPLKLNQDIANLQKNQVWANIVRFVMIAGSLIFLPFTFIAILANGLPRIWANIKLRKETIKFADLSENEDPEIKEEIVGMVKRTMPGAIYFCISSQITIWLISIYGSTAGIAKIGALSRLTVALSLFTTLFSTLIIPRFARLTSTSKLLLFKFVQILAALFLVSVLIIGAVYLFPEEVLFVLGKNYSDLNKEVVLITISGCIAMTSGIAYSLTVSRGWILPPYIHIPISIGVQAVLIALMDLSNTADVLIFSIINVSVGLTMTCIYFLYRISKSHE